MKNQPVLATFDFTLYILPEELFTLRCHNKVTLQKNSSCPPQDGHVTGLTLAGCITPPVQLEAVHISVSLASICGCDNGHRNVISSPGLRKTCPVHGTKLKHRHTMKSLCVCHGVCVMNGLHLHCSSHGDLPSPPSQLSSATKCHALPYHFFDWLV